jgi:hypothetical protein
MSNAKSCTAMVCGRQRWSCDESHHLRKCDVPFERIFWVCGVGQLELEPAFASQVPVHVKRKALILRGGSECSAPAGNEQRGSATFTPTSALL